MRILSSVIAISVGLIATGCDRESEAQRVEDQKHWEELMSTYAETRDELRTKYKAVLFPPEEFEEHAIFTYTLQQYLTATADKPILFKGIVDDITNENNEFIVHTTAFFSKHPHVDGRRLLVHIRANRNDIQPLLEESTNRAEPTHGACQCPLRGPLTYFVVRVKTVSKVQDGLKREAYGYGAEDTSLYEAVADLVALKRLPE